MKKSLSVILLIAFLLANSSLLDTIRATEVTGTSNVEATQTVSGEATETVKKEATPEVKPSAEPAASTEQSVAATAENTAPATEEKQTAVTASENTAAATEEKQTAAAVSAAEQSAAVTSENTAAAAVTEESAPAEEEVDFSDITPYYHEDSVRSYSFRSSVPANPVIGVDHPTKTGEVMLFKEATPVPGMVNTWNIRLRVEGKDKDTPVYTVLVLDTSGSMEGKKLENAQKAAKKLVKALKVDGNTSSHVALVEFNEYAAVLAGFDATRQQLLNAIGNTEADGGTFTQAGIDKAEKLLAAVENMPANAIKNIVLLSDGKPTYGYKLNNPVYGPEIQIKDLEYDSDTTYTGPGKITVLGQPEANYTTRKVGSGAAMYFKIQGSPRFLLIPGKPYRFQNLGYSTIDQANYFKNRSANNVVYSVALQAGTEGTDVLGQIASTGCFYKADTPEQLEGIFAKIGGSILSACVDADVTDPMAPGMTVTDATAVSAVPDSSVVVRNGVIYWSPGTLTEPISEGSDIKYAELTYQVEITPQILKTDDVNGHAGFYFTNGEASVSYIDSTGAGVDKAFPKPYVNPVFYLIKKVEQDHNGNAVKLSREWDFKVTNAEAGYEKTYSISDTSYTGTKYASTALITSLRDKGVYTVTETEDSAHFEKPVFTVGQEGEKAEARNTFTIRKDNEKDVYITVVNKRKAGKLTIEKKLDQVKTSRRSARSVDSVSFEFTLTGPNNYKQTFNLPENGSWSKTFDNLGWGEYTVTETPNDKYDTSYKVDGTASADGKVLIDGTTSLARTVTVTNSVNTEFKMTAHKVWLNGATPKGIYLRLYRVDPETGSEVAVSDARLLKAGATETTFTQSNNDVNKTLFVEYNDKGNAYTYIVKETDDKGEPATLPGYYKIENGLTVKNGQYPAFDYAFTKELVNGKIADKQFSFTYFLADNKGAQVGAAHQATNDALGKVTITLNEITSEGTHYVLVKEDKGTDPYVVYDDAVYLVTVETALDGEAMTHKVVGVQKKNADGSFTASEGGVNFSNTYYGEIEWTPDITKELKNQTLKDDVYSFTLLQGKDVVSTGYAKADGKVVFEPIKYGLGDVGEHKYQIKEVIPPVPVPGILYDSHTLNVTVTVKDLGKGKLSATAVYGDGESKTFTNVYKASGTVGISVSKVLNGRDLTAGEFEFVLKRSDGAKFNVVNGSGFEAVNELRAKNGSGLTTASVKFAQDLYFTEQDLGEHQFQVKEVLPAEPEKGMTYASDPVTITVKVEDNGDGTLTVTAVYPENATFTNTYKASGTADVTLTKELTGRALKAGEFSFTMKRSDGAKFKAVVNDKVEELSELQGTNAAGASSAAVSFIGKLYFDQNDIGKVYTYVVTEDDLKAGGITYDTQKIEFKVTVSDLTGGKLLAKVEGTEGKAFKNTYTASGKTAIVVIKEMQGRPMETGEFDFLLKRADGKPFKVVKGNGFETVNEVGGKNAAGGADKTFVYFEKNLYFDQNDVGTTKFVVTEVIPTETKGVQYDTKTITIPVVVTDNGDGTLTAKPQLPEDHKFVNKYTGNAEWTPSFTKLFNAGGRELKANEFEFNLVLDGKVIDTAKNLKDGSVTFKTIKYTEEDLNKTFKYTVEEVKGDEKGVTYDAGKVQVNVTVSLDKATGKLVVTKVFVGEKKGFENSYEAKGSFVPEVSKVLKAGGRVLKDGEFTFKLIDKYQNKDLTAVNDKTGKVVFSPLLYTQEDINKTFTYTITEVKGTEKGMTYDKHEVTLTVEVLDKGNGELDFKVNYEGGQVFTNTYKAEGFYTPVVMKTLTGRAIMDGEFLFELKDETGKVYNAKNDKDGKVTFPELFYDESAIGKEFVYEITEVEPAKPEKGMVYDGQSVKIRVIVKDAGDGALDIEVVPDSEKTAFENHYTASGLWAPELTKRLEGRNLKAKDFEFELRLNGQVITTGTNDADGKIVFAPIKFTEKNIGKTYVFEVNEKVPAQPAARTTYDKKVIKVALTVTDGRNGVLVFDTAYPDKTQEFVNTYELLKKDITVTKTWSGGPAEHPAVEVQLYRDGKAFGEPVKLVDGKYTWKGLEAEDLDCKAYEFSVKEVSVPEGYEASYEATEDGFAITNTYVEVTKTGEAPLIGLLAVGAFGAAVLAYAVRRELKKREEN